MTETQKKDLVSIEKQIKTRTSIKLIENPSLVGAADLSKNADLRYRTVNYSRIKASSEYWSTISVVNFVLSLSHRSYFQ